MVRLNEVVKAKSGNGKIKGRLLKKNNGSLFPGFSATGQDVFVENYDYDSEGIVISAVGARCGKCFLANGKWSAIANTHVLLPKNKKVMAKYVWLIVNDENFWIRGGVAQPFVKVNDSLNKKIPLPPIKVQKEILSIFSKIEIDLDITIDVYKSTEEFKFAIINHFFK
jgi:type I restriction enzyme S subunit